MQENNQNDEFSIYGTNFSQCQQDLYFNDCITAIQQIVLDNSFQECHRKFIEQNSAVFFTNGIEQRNRIFQQHAVLVKNQIKTKANLKLPEFDIVKFLQMVPNKKQYIDNQLLDMLVSLIDYQSFQLLIQDYGKAHQQEQALRTLTIKSKKNPEIKKVKGSENIFTNEAVDFLSKDPLSDLKMNQMKKKPQLIQKKEEEILVPDLVLTIKPIKKF